MKKILGLLLLLFYVNIQLSAQDDINFLDVIIGKSNFSTCDKILKSNFYNLSKIQNDTVLYNGIYECSDASVMVVFDKDSIVQSTLVTIEKLKPVNSAEVYAYLIYTFYREHKNFGYDSYSDSSGNVITTFMSAAGSVAFKLGFDQDYVYISIHYSSGTLTEKNEDRQGYYSGFDYMPKDIILKPFMILQTLKTYWIAKS